MALTGSSGVEPNSPAVIAPMLVPKGTIGRSAAYCFSSSKAARAAGPILVAWPPAAYPPVVEWCHPSSGDFNSYAVTDDGKAVVSLMAIVSGPAFSTSVTESDVGSSTGNIAGRPSLPKAT